MAENDDSKERNPSPGVPNSVLAAIGFREELAMLINRHNMENDSDTPDFIMAEYIADCMRAYSQAVRSRDKWYGLPEKDLINNLAVSNDEEVTHAD